MEVLWISLAFVLGLGTRQVGLPPLVGYLLAGFALNAFGQWSGVHLEGSEALKHIAHQGVLLLLFTVGLKLRLRNVFQPEVWGSALVHLALTILLLTPGFHYLGGITWYTALLLAIALSFSSTVVAAKVLEGKRELKAFHGRVAIGILIIQDLVALAVLSLTSDHTPSLLAPLVLALPLLRRPLYRLMDLIGHDELLILLGLLLAFAGGQSFELLGLSSELGALLLGAILANHARAPELAHALWGLKEIFLVGFFLSIGMSGLPSVSSLTFALLMAAVLIPKAVLFFLILLRFRLRARSAFLTGLSLASYSEFGLIVANLVLPEWTVFLAITTALSFVIAAPLNRAAHGLYEKLEQKLTAFELDERHPDEQPLSLGRSHIIIMGMGRTGTAAYDFLNSRHERLVGLDADPGKVQYHLQHHRRVLYADAEDPGFWHGLQMAHIEAVILSMGDTEAKVIATRQLRSRGFTGLIVASSLYEDQAAIVSAAGADMTFMTFSEAGVGLAEHVWLALYGNEPAPASENSQ